MSGTLVRLQDVKFNKNGVGFFKFFMNVKGRKEQEKFEQVLRRISNTPIETKH